MTDRDDFDLKMEIDYWRSVAVYLADCHAATAYEYEPKSTSKARRNRMISIMTTCIDALPDLPKMPLPILNGPIFVIGDYEIIAATDGGYWLYHESGEGMHLPPGRLEKVIADFYKENF